MTEVKLSGLVEGRSAVSLTEIGSLDGIEDITGLGENTVGEAVPAGAVVALAKPTAEAAWCSVISADGEYSASIPISDLAGDGWLAFRLGDGELPGAAGGPVRLTVAQGKTLCWNVKNVGELRFTAEKEPDSLPARPTH